MAENIVEAMFNIQSKALKPAKSGTNPHFRSKYVTLEALLEVLLPAINEEGVVLAQTLADIEGKPALSTQLIHVATQGVFESRTPMVFAKEDPQAVGSAITYYRRYALMALLGLVGEEDDDGNAASAAPKSKPAPRRKPKAAATPDAEEEIDSAPSDSLGGSIF